MLVDDDIVDIMVELINLTGQYIAKEEENKLEYNEELEKKYRKLVISGYIYARNLEELLRE
jgi:predicted house-cleaning noncanonical NTP pyrophosphatase (MazG superfamily)